MKQKIITIALIFIVILSINIDFVNAEEIKKIDTYNLILNKLDEDTREPITTHASYEIVAENGQKITASTDEKGQIKIHDIKLPQVAGKYKYTITETEAPNEYKKEESVGILEIIFENRPGGSQIEMDDNGNQYQTSDLIIKNAQIISGDNIWIEDKSNGGWTEDTVNVYVTDKYDPLYLKSNVYEIGYHIYPENSENNENIVNYDLEYQSGDTYIRKVVKYDENGKPVISSKLGRIEVTIEEFKKNLITNAYEIKILDSEGNEILDDKSCLRTGMTLSLKKSKEEINLKIIVYGDTGTFIDTNGYPKWIFMKSALEKCVGDYDYYKTLTDFEKEAYDLTFSGKFGIGEPSKLQRQIITVTHSVADAIASNPEISYEDIGINF